MYVQRVPNTPISPPSYLVSYQHHPLAESNWNPEGIKSWDDITQIILQGQRTAWKDGSSTTGWPHVYALISGFNSLRKIPLSPNPNYLAFLILPTKYYADARVSRQNSCHDLEPQGPLLSQSQTQRAQCSPGDGWEQHLPVRAIWPRPGRAAAAPVWRQGRADGVGGECDGVGYCHQMLRAHSCCFIAYQYPPTTQSDPAPKFKDAEAVKSCLSRSLNLKMTLMMSLFAYPSINGNTMVLRTIGFSSTFYMLLNI